MKDDQNVTFNVVICGLGGASEQADFNVFKFENLHRKFEKVYMSFNVCLRFH